MTREGLPQEISPGELDRLGLLSDIERQTFEFSENNRALAALVREMHEREDARQRQLESWQESGVALPLRGWARDYNIGGAMGENVGFQKLPYDDGRQYERRGGLIPPDRYIIVETRSDLVHGPMVWVKPALNPEQMYYHVLSRTLRFVTDADILRYRQAST